MSSGSFRHASGICLGILGIAFLSMTAYELLTGNGGLAVWLFGSGEDENGFPLPTGHIVYLAPSDHSD
jgi:hypothetical protein